MEFKSSSNKWVIQAKKVFSQRDKVWDSIRIYMKELMLFERESLFIDLLNKVRPVFKLCKDKMVALIERALSQRNKFISEGFSLFLILSGASLVVVFLTVFALWGDFFNTNQDAIAKTDVFGQLGDVVGGVVGSLWALAGVVLFYSGLKDQRKDIQINRNALKKQVDALNYQRAEIKQQTREYRNANSVYKEQTATLKKQQFESNFYSLIDIYVKIRGEIFSEDSDCFEKYMISKNNFSAEEEWDVINGYLHYHYERREVLSNYFGMMYRILKTIDSSFLEDSDKDFYAKVLRSMLSEKELLVLYYHSHSIYGDSVYPLVLKYNVLKFLSPLSKIEFGRYRQGDAEFEVKIRLFFEWLDKFLITAMEGAYDLDKDDGFKTVKRYPLVEELFVEVDVEDGFIMKVYSPLNSERVVLGREVQDIARLIELYVSDRFFFNCFKSITADDKIDCESVEEDQNFVIKVSVDSDKELGVTKDEYGE